MSGKVHYEGQEYLGLASLKNTGHATLYIGLYTNGTALAKNQTMVNVTEVSGGGYARKVLNTADWVVDPTKTANQGTLFAQTRKDWLFTSAVGNVTGYFITTSLTGSTGKLIASEHFSAPANVNQADFEIRVTPRNEFR